MTSRSNWSGLIRTRDAEYLFRGVRRVPFCHKLLVDIVDTPNRQSNCSSSSLHNTRPLEAHTKRSLLLKELPYTLFNILWLWCQAYSFSRLLGHFMQFFYPGTRRWFIILYILHGIYNQYFHLIWEVNTCLVRLICSCNSCPRWKKHSLNHTTGIQSITAHLSSWGTRWLWTWAIPESHPDSWIAPESKLCYIMWIIWLKVKVS